MHIISDMSVGFDQERNLYNLGDSAEIRAYVRDDEDNLVPEDDLVTVGFVVQAPDGTKTTLAGTIEGPGTGFVRYTTTAQTGAYVAVATFTLASGQKKSSRSDFEVIDPFNPPAPADAEIIGALVWRKLEDCFDADDEGPWLRDMTLNFFNDRKMQEFIDEALFDINQWTPMTDLTIKQFVFNSQPNADAPLLVLATFISVILHLMASYTEQPLPTGAQVVYEDRRDYLMRWQQLYTIEYQRYRRWVVLWKRQFLGLGHAKGLVSTKAGRLISAPLRTWQVGRGYR